MFYIEKGKLRLFPLSYDGRSKIYNYNEIKHLGEAFLTENLEGNRLRLKIEWDGAVVGEISLHSIKWFNRKAMITLHVYPEFQRKKLGTEACQLLLDFGFQVMNLFRIEAEIVEGNEASIRLFENLGFRKEGTLRKAKYLAGDYYDIFIYGILKPDWKNFNFF